MVTMSKNQKIKDNTPGGNNLLVQIKKLQKKLTQSVSKLDENVKKIESVGDEDRKTRVQAMSSELYDVAETIHDMNMVIDEVIGDDMLNLNEKDILEKFENLEVAPALIEDLQRNLKNFHKVYYDKTINNDLKLLAYHDLDRNWKSLNKNLAKILANLNGLIQQMV
jgi:DNA-binding protein H-NS